MPQNRQNQEAAEKLAQECKPALQSAPGTDLFDDPETLAEIIKGLLNGRLE